ncbi:MAG: suppressor of fused domain protein [Pirellulaceae bacterium]|nr:suppressor of fused domain protein [Pirellulaceae bacterium]
MLLKQRSPQNNLEAIVEDDGQSVYFYLQAREGIVPEDRRFKACWVRNRTAAPLTFERSTMASGKAPLLPMMHCNHPEGLGPLEETELHVLWLESGDGAALYENETPLALITPWSGTDGNQPYASECIDESPLCWPLAGQQEAFDLLERTTRFWNLWDEENFWTKSFEQILATYEEQFGECQRRYDISQEVWPPKQLLEFHTDEERFFLTAGVSLRQMPTGEFLSIIDPNLGARRCEFAMAIPHGTSNEVTDHWLGYLSGQTNFPWTYLRPLGHGYTLQCPERPFSNKGEDVKNGQAHEVDDSTISAVILTKGGPIFPQVDVPPFTALGEEEKAELLWLCPISSKEKELAISEGSDQLLERLATKKILFA